MSTPDPIIAIDDGLSNKSTALVGSITGSIYSVHLERQLIIEKGTHSDAISGLFSLPTCGWHCSVSYDKTMKFWDLRAPKEVGKITFPERIYCADVKQFHGRIVLGLSGEKVFVSELRALSNMFGREATDLVDSPLGKGSQISAISLSKINRLVALATTDGRVNVLKLGPAGTSELTSMGTWEAHKLDAGEGGNSSGTKILYPVHAVGFHPQVQNRLFTAGGDGKLHFWDFEEQRKMSSLEGVVVPITKAAFSNDGRFLAYARGYDWASGIKGDMSCPISVGVHEFQDPR